MPEKRKLDEATIIRIEAEKRAVTNAAQAYIRAKASFDRAQKLEGSATWAQSTEGKGFIAATNAATEGNAATPSTTAFTGRVRNFFLGNPEKNIYERTTRNEFSGGERLSSYVLPKAFGGLDGDQTKAMRDLQRAQSELQEAQTKLHKTMDDTFGTRTDSSANGDASLLEAAKTIGGGFGAVKGVGRILGGLGSIVFGGADDRFGEVHIKNGGLVVTGPRKDDRPSLVKRFMNDDSYVPRGGIVGVLQTPFQAVGNLLRGHPIDAVLTLFKGVESAVYLAADTALTLGKVAYLPVNMAYNAVKTVGLLGYKGLVAGAAAISAIKGETADFSLESHVVAADLKDATDLKANDEKYEKVDKAIENHPEAKKARDEARTAKAEEIDAVNTHADRSPQQKIEINAAGREAGQAVLDAQKSSTDVNLDNDSVSSEIDFPDDISEVTDNNDYTDGSFDEDDDKTLLVSTTPMLPNPLSQTSAANDLKNALGSHNEEVDQQDASSLVNDEDNDDDNRPTPR